MNPTKVSIVEDDNEVRQSLAVLINGSEGFRCVSAHRSAEEALAGIPPAQPDVALVDINLPRQSGMRPPVEGAVTQPALPDADDV
jgi:DNA-binding NarL/FixJ family response regulator